MKKDKTMFVSTILKRKTAKDGMILVSLNEKYL